MGDARCEEDEGGWEGVVFSRPWLPGLSAPVRCRCILHLQPVVLLSHHIASPVLRA